MRKSIFYLFAPMIFLLFITTIAQDNKEQQIQSTITKLFEMCKNKEYEKAKEYLAYIGYDQTRNKKDTYNYDIQSEKQKVDRICKKINALTKLSESFNFGDYKFNNKNYEHTQNIIFVSGEQKLKTKFVFIEFNGKFLLIDID